MLAHMQMRPFIATYKAASTKFKSYTVYYMCVACTFVHTRTHTHHKHTRTPNGIIAESNGCVPCASTQKKERNIWWMTFVNERQRNRLHAHCCNVCKVLLSSLSCSLALSPSNITRIFTFNSSVIIAIAYKSWFLFCFFVFHSFSNGYFFAMHSFVYIFWTENNTPNATFTQTLNLNLPCSKKKCVTLAFTAEFSDTFISQALLNVLCTIVILVNGFLFFFCYFAVRSILAVKNHPRNSLTFYKFSI